MSDIPLKSLILPITKDGVKTPQKYIIEGLSDDAKTALLACFQHVVWTDEHGQDYYDDLYDAFYPHSVVSIDAVFTQGSAFIYADDSLDILKNYLVVTANYSDGTSAVITNYTLSGTLAVGTSTVTVLYAECTDTFTVTVTGRRRELPATYEQVEYIVGTGTQWITFDMVSQIPMSVEAKMLYTRADSNVFTADTGSGVNDSIFRMLGFGEYGSGSSADIGVRFGSVTSWVYAHGYALNILYDIQAGIYKNGGSTFAYVQVDDNARVTQALGGAPSVGNPMRLCKRAEDTWIGKGFQIYSLKVYAGEDQKIFDGIPCYRKSDNKTGLYDAVTSTFYSSEGTDEFVTGNVIN